VAVRCIRSDSVWQVAGVEGKHGVCVSDSAGHRRPISAIGDVQLRGDELIGQNKTGIAMDWRIEDSQQLGLVICLAAQCHRQGTRGPRIGIIFPVTLSLRTRGRRGQDLRFERADAGAVAASGFGEAQVNRAGETGSALVRGRGGKVLPFIKRRAAANLFLALLRHFRRYD